MLFACFASLYATKAVPAAATLTARDVNLSAEVPPPADPLAELRKTFADIAEGDFGVASVEVDATSRGLVLSLPEAGSFPPGRADLTPEAELVMLTIADALGRLPNLVRVEGHTDDRPINTPLFSSNWDLSTARATRVVQLLTGEGGLDPRRLSAAGYAEFRPRVPNVSPDARARNRRVDIVVLDQASARAEEPGDVGR
jgi:chemotaxis protein MotB